MSANGQQPVIIVVKKGGGHGGHHGGSWKVAIADLMTAMMAMFMVLWLIGQSPKTRATVGAYFRDPMGLAGGGNTDSNSGPLSGGSGFFDGGTTAMSQDLMISPGQIMIDRQGGGGAQKKSMVENQAARNRLAQAMLKLRQQNWARNVELTAVEKGLRIEIQDTEDLVLFPTGTTNISADFRPILKRIAEELAGVPNHLVIEGHTDRGGQNNWELSTRRANTARSFLEQNGVRRSQIVEVRGYADRRLRLWHDPKNPRNRRISILVLLERGKVPQPPNKPPPAKHKLEETFTDLDAMRTAPPNLMELDPKGKRLPPTPSKGPK